MTAQLSRERLEEIASYGIGAENYPRRAEWMQMARMLLAGMDSEPVAKVDNIGVCWYADDGVSRKPAVGAALYIAPPSSVAVPDELTREEYKRRFMEEDNFDDTYRSGWEACRAAMLKAGPVTAATWIAEAKKMAEMHGTSFVVFRNGEEPQCADPSKVVISFSDKGLGYPAAPEQEG